MSIILSDEYPTRAVAPSADYPQGSAKSGAPGSNEGTPWAPDIFNDQLGFLQALLSEGGVVPSGVPDTATSSDYLQAAKNILLGSAVFVYQSMALTGEVHADKNVVINSIKEAPPGPAVPVVVTLAAADFELGDTVTIYGSAASAVDLITTSDPIYTGQTSPLPAGPGRIYAFTLGPGGGWIVRELNNLSPSVIPINSAGITVPGEYGDKILALNTDCALSLDSTEFSDGDQYTVMTGGTENSELNFVGNVYYNGDSVGVGSPFALDQGTTYSVKQISSSAVPVPGAGEWEVTSYGAQGGGGGGEWTDEVPEQLTGPATLTASIYGKVALVSTDSVEITFPAGADLQVGARFRLAFIGDAVGSGTSFVNGPTFLLLGVSIPVTQVFFESGYVYEFTCFNASGPGVWIMSKYLVSDSFRTALSTDGSNWADGVLRVSETVGIFENVGKVSFFPTNTAGAPTGAPFFELEASSLAIRHNTGAPMLTVNATNLEYTTNAGLTQFEVTPTALRYASTAGTNLLECKNASGNQTLVAYHADGDTMLVADDNGMSYTTDAGEILISLTSDSAKFTAPVELPTFAVASPPPSPVEGMVAYFSDGDAGAKCLAVYDGTDWRRVPLSVAISAT